MSWLKARCRAWRWPMILALTVITLPMLLGAGPVAFCNPRGICACMGGPEVAWVAMIGLTSLVVLSFSRGHKCSSR